ncbi:MAG: DUF58 domain-containing protein [Victivallales bacterium]|nr:DUF58 domain-containing protein [Victivallales bacterium]
MEPQSILDDLHLLDLKEEIRCLVLHARREVESGLGGAYAARRRGTGVEFEELREFVDGDDARFIHWPSTLTQGRPFVKRYREEHQLDMLICMDVSKSMRVMQTVMQTALEIAALMGGCACYVGDAVGLLLRSTATEGWLPPCRGERQLLRILREIAGCRLSDGGTDLDGMLTAAANVLKRHSRVVVISDWLGDSSGNELRYLAYRHEVVVCHIQTDAVQKVPLAGWLETEDAETGRRLLVDWSDSRNRHEIALNQEKMADGLRKQSHGAKADYLLFDGSEPPVEVIRGWLRR